MLSGRDSAASVIPEQMELAAKLVMNSDDRPVDITDQAISEDDIRDFPVTGSTRIRQRVKIGDDSGFASRLDAKRFVREPCQFRLVPAICHDHSSRAGMRKTPAKPVFQAALAFY
jgi:hypothetical protein